jgi:group I intron endonuclease
MQVVSHTFIWPTVDMKSGIYKISNTVSGSFYIGRSVDAPDRMAHHRNQLRRGVHVNKHMQNSWDKYGEGAFLFEHIWEEEQDTLEETEGILLRSLWWRDNLYNHHYHSFGGFEPGNKLGCFSRSEETKQKLRLANLGKKASAEARKKMSLAHKGKKRSDEFRKKLGDARRGKSQPKLQCPHCSKIGGNSNMVRWHFSNCKQKVI